MSRALKAINTHTSPRRISILGATGSIGQSTIKLLKQHKGQYAVEALVALSNAEQLAKDAKELNASIAVIADEAHHATLKSALAGTGIETAAGEKAVIEAMQRPADWVMSAIVGAAGLKPTLEAIRQGCIVALANKECLVCAGALVKEEAKKSGATLLPVDSEHNALYQVFYTEQQKAVERVTLTASGGPFRTFTKEQMKAITPEQAVRHPNWQMGAKISVDSATLMNKGLEVIEAYHLFPLEAKQIDVVVHPESIVHGLVHYSDGSVLAGLSLPDMVTPIAHALGWPERIKAEVPRLDLAKIGALHFEAVDAQRFPALGLAYKALEMGGSATATLNAANEVAVAAFLQGKLRFLQLPEIVAETLASLGNTALSSLEDVLAADGLARAKAQGLIG